MDIIKRTDRIARESKSSLRVTQIAVETVSAVSQKVMLLVTRMGTLGVEGRGTRAFASVEQQKDNLL